MKPARRIPKTGYSVLLRCPKSTQHHQLAVSWFLRIDLPLGATEDRVCAVPSAVVRWSDISRACTWHRLQRAGLERYNVGLAGLEQLSKVVGLGFRV